MQHQRDQSSPASLVRGTKSGAGLAMKVLIEQQMVAERRFAM
jgi:hypothetical protein